MESLSDLMLGGWQSDSISPNISSTPRIHLQRRGAVAPACWKCSWCTQWDRGSHISNSSLQMMQGLGAHVQPHTAMQGCATKTLPLHRSSSTGHPRQQSRHGPSPWPHTSPAWPGVQKSYSRSTIPSLTSAKPSPSCP